MPTRDSNGAVLCEFRAMAQTISVIVSPEDRARLTAVIGDRNRPLKHVQRVWIVLLSADRLPVLEISRQTGVSLAEPRRVHTDIISKSNKYQFDNYQAYVLLLMAALNNV